jgi:hypothetical protein
MSEPRDSERLIQLDLFRVPPTIPDWERLSPDVRHKAVILLARLLRPRSQAPVAADHGREVGDE